MYGDEIKKFLESIGDNETLKESMKTLVFDSHATEIMVGLVTSFHNLETLELIDCNYLEGEYFPLIKTQKLRKLNLRGSHQIGYEHIQNLVVNNASTLRVLKIDGENISGDDFTVLIENIEELEQLSVYYANEASASLLKALAAHRNTIIKLKVRKNENFLSEDFSHFFSHKFPKLKSLVLDE